MLPEKSLTPDMGDLASRRFPGSGLTGLPSAGLENRGCRSPGLELLQFGIRTSAIGKSARLRVAYFLGGGRRCCY